MKLKKEGDEILKSSGSFFEMINKFYISVSGSSFRITGKGSEGNRVETRFDQSVCEKYLQMTDFFAKIYPARDLLSV